MQVLVFLLVASATVRSASAATACPAAPTVTTALCECATPNTDDCAIGKVCNPGPPKVCADPPANQPPGGGGAPAAPLRCQNKDGSLLPSATICEDKLDQATCDAVFGAAAPAGGQGGQGGQGGGGGQGGQGGGQGGQGGGQGGQGGGQGGQGGGQGGQGGQGGGAPAAGGQRSDKCDLPDLSDLALNCAKTCKVCCETAEYGCEDDTSFGIDCQQQKSKCKIAQWTSVMSTACPLTCGLCNAGACKDTIAGCGSLKTLCRDFTYRSYMSTNCARTCQACNNNGGGAVVPPAADCVDTGVNCGGYTSWCTGPADQQNIMRTSCKKTCGFC